MRPAPLAIVAAVVPTAAVFLAFYLSASAGHISMCNPLLDGCSSISATGREPPGALVRAALLPYAALLAAIWVLAVAWLRSVDAVSAATARWILIAGLTGSAALIVYVTFLGTRTPVYSFMRRFGIYLYFSGTAVAQLLVTLRIKRLAPEWRIAGVSSWMLAAVALPFMLGIGNLVQKAVLPDAQADAIENAIEWVASLSMQAWFLGLYLAWRRTGFAITTVTTSAPRDGRGQSVDRGNSGCGR